MKRLEPKEFNTKDIAVEFLVNFMENMQHSAFYYQDRDVVNIYHRDYPNHCLIIQAVGEMLIVPREEDEDTITELPDVDGIFENDEDIYEKLIKNEDEYYFDLQNWFEIMVFDIDTAEIIGSTETTHSYISNSIYYAVGEFENIMDYFNIEKTDFAETI